jgi:hypothetical protein
VFIAVDEELLNTSYIFMKRFHESCNSVKDYFWEHSPQDVFQRSLLRFLLVPLSEFSESEVFDAMKSYLELSLPEQEELAAAAAASMAYITFLIIMVIIIVVSPMLWT